MCPRFILSNVSAMVSDTIITKDVTAEFEYFDLQNVCTCLIYVEDTEATCSHRDYRAYLSTSQSAGKKHLMTKQSVQLLLTNVNKTSLASNRARKVSADVCVRLEICLNVTTTDPVTANHSVADELVSF